MLEVTFHPSFYRVFIKYCVFSLKFCDFSELCQFSCSAGVLPAWYVYTHWHQGKTEKGQSSEYSKIFEKNTIFNEHPVHTWAISSLPYILIHIIRLSRHHICSLAMHIHNVLAYSRPCSTWYFSGKLHTTRKCILFCCRNLFIFKIVPMLNPDGVIVGNTR